MSWIDRLKNAFTRTGPDAGAQTEADVPLDSATARSRATGGVEDPEAVAQNSTTGTTPNETFVGRAGGDETDVGQLGGEARAQYEDGQYEDGQPETPSS
jgi:hypothetical protein